MSNITKIPKYLRIPQDIKKLLRSSSSEIVQNLAFRFRRERKNVSIVDSFSGCYDRNADVLLMLLDRDTSDHSFEICQRLVESKERHVVVIEDDSVSSNRTFYDKKVEELEPWMWLPALTVLKGPMFAGKTLRLLEFLRCTEGADKDLVKILKPEIDTRSRGFVKSHRGEAYPVTESLQQSLKDVKYDDGTFILIDEAQFFDESIVDFCMNTIKTQPRSTIVTAGLDFDFRRRSFGYLNHLVEILTTTHQKEQQAYSPIRVENLLSECRVCGSPAAYTMRSSNIKTQVLIGASDEYYPVCEEHHQ